MWVLQARATYWTKYFYAFKKERYLAAPIFFVNMRQYTIDNLDAKRCDPSTKTLATKKEKCTTNTNKENTANTYRKADGEKKKKKKWKTPHN